MNKFGRQTTVKPLTHVDGVPIADLVAEHGSPLFIFSQRTLIRRYRELRDAMSRRYPKVRLAWSYKTNYLEAICRTLHDEGAWAEVVSPFEYDKAIATGVPADHIHFNGPFKPDNAIEKAVTGGSIIHIDNFDEIVRIERIAARLERKAKVAVRVNMAIDGLPSWSRFGLNLESGQAREAAGRVIASDHMELLGLHAHIGTFILDPACYTTSASKLAGLANDLRASYGHMLSFIDLGGGFASQNTLKGQYLMGEQASPSFARYADAICDGLAELDYPTKDLPTLVLETGRALVDDSGYLVSSVCATKRLGDGQRALVLDAGVNVLFTSFWYKHDVVPAHDTRGVPEPTVLYGPLCMNIDVLRDSTPLPPMTTGDRVVFRNVGAYNVTQWMQFIAMRPAVVMVGEGGRVARIRRAESGEDISSYEGVPSWLLK
ncbi:MAG: diaminopimelate decarboxylase [Myxococcales bacterium]|nr:diaminopimelate decarboxylase [Myxococcales bacterium]MBL0198479.1 diaminopimelate decarboxylase [Myxococcales bacterium]